jgi:hypothetical protein
MGCDFDPSWHRKLQSARQKASLVVQLADQRLRSNLRLPGNLENQVGWAARQLEGHHGSELPSRVQEHLSRGMGRWNSWGNWNDDWQKVQRKKENWTPDNTKPWSFVRCNRNGCSRSEYLCKIRAAVCAGCSCRWPNNVLDAAVHLGAKVPGYKGSGKWAKGGMEQQSENAEVDLTVGGDAGGVGSEQGSNVPWIRSKDDRAANLKALLEDARKEGLLDYAEETIQWAVPDEQMEGAENDEKEESTRQEQANEESSESAQPKGQNKEDEGEAFKAYLACERKYRHSRKKWSHAVKACRDWDDYVRQLTDKLEAARSQQSSKKEWADWWLDKYTVYQAEMEEASQKHKQQLVKGGEPGAEMGHAKPRKTEECKDIFKDMEAQLEQQLEGV